MAAVPGRPGLYLLGCAADPFRCRAVLPDQRAWQPSQPRNYRHAIHELKEFVILAVYLYITIGAVIMMKTAVLHTEGIDFAPWGIAIVKAMLLAKFMLVGRAMKIGEREHHQPADLADAA
jgi:hypothetical protein